MPRGASPKREKEYEELKEKFHEEHRYPGREKEVASRIVNKQRAQYGETKGEKKERKEGKAPDRNLPIRDYQRLTVPEIASRLGNLSKKEIGEVKQYERRHKNRKTLMEDLSRATGGRRRRRS